MNEYAVGHLDSAIVEWTKSSEIFEPKSGHYNRLTNYGFARIGRAYHDKNDFVNGITFRHASLRGELMRKLDNSRNSKPLQTCLRRGTKYYTNEHIEEYLHDVDRSILHEITGDSKRQGGDFKGAIEEYNMALMIERNLQFGSSTPVDAYLHRKIACVLACNEKRMEWDRIDRVGNEWLKNLNNGLMIFDAIRNGDECLLEMDFNRAVDKYDKAIALFEATHSLKAKANSIADNIQTDIQSARSLLAKYGNIFELPNEDQNEVVLAIESFIACATRIWDKVALIEALNESFHKRCIEPGHQERVELGQPH